MIPWPTENQTLQNWADNLRQLRPDFDIQPIIKDEKTWQEWGNRLIQSAVLQTSNAPRTEGFSDWKLWAESLIRSLGQNV